MTTAMHSTLGHVTTKKLEKLDEQRVKFTERKATAISASDEQKLLADKVRVLLEGCERLNLKVDQTRSNLSVKDIRLHFLDQAKHDPSVSPAILEQWRQRIVHDLDVQALKYEYASLFGRLVTEWIEHPNDANLASSARNDSKDSDGEESSASFEQIGREEMHDQRKEWESYTFTAKPTDEKKIAQYLEGLFSSTIKSKKLKKTPIEQLRESLKTIDKTSPTEFDGDVVEQCISGLLKADLFAGSKREALVSLQEQKDVLKEIADVLNLELESLSEWAWDPQPIPVQMRRQINGKYRVFMDEELHQAILLQFIGMKWAVQLMTSFASFFHSGAWQVNPFHSMSKRDKMRREFFLGSNARLRADNTVRNKRRKMFEEEYYMTQLPRSFDVGGRDYGDDETDSELDSERKSPMKIKQSMLRLATTELQINTELYGQSTILQSDFKWFGPSLPHSTILTVLKFFGVSDKWLGFFKTFLETPLSFAQDGPDAEVRQRKRGIPMSHVLSDALGEAVLFCLDFAVNQRTKGANIYRFHDDLWFWGQESVCIEAWAAMQEFTSVMGLDLNLEKTGTAQVFSDGSTKKLSAALPEGKVRWGFLELDSKTGRWIIEKDEVEKHIVELQRQLGACRSVMAWVQAYNSYVDRFFTANFGQPARCLGREHVKMQIETFEHIHRRLFETGTGKGAASVTEYLRGVISDRFGVKDIPDGFFYLPIEIGGLELRSPFIPLFLQARHPFLSPKTRLDRVLSAEEEAYEEYKTKFDEGEVPRTHDGRHGIGYKPEEDEPFMSLEEFTRFREETSEQLYKAYEELLDASPDDFVTLTLDVQNAVQNLEVREFKAQGFAGYLSGLDSYWTWVLELYAPDLLRRFGGLTMGEQGLLPVGLLNMLRSEKVRWQG